MNKSIYDIQIRSVRAAVNHLHLLDLTELAEGAAIHGSPADQAMLRAIVACLSTLPNDHSP